MTHAGNFSPLTMSSQRAFVDGAQNRLNFEAVPKFRSAWKIFVSESVDYTFATVYSSPGARLLAFHLAISKVFHATGMANEIYKAFEAAQRLHNVLVGRADILKVSAEQGMFEATASD